jgi:3-oxoacyl-[acyl-carrier-protein] synthase III
MDTVRIIGTGSCLPPTILTNFDLQKMGLDTTDEWIVQRTGIRERRIADPEVATSDLGFEAAVKALDMSGLTAKDLDLIIMATITPDMCCPSAANFLQAKLDAPQAITFDITAACSGFIFGLNIAEQYLKNKTCRYVLVVASEVMTRTLNWKDRTTCILWGDGAGAALLTWDKKGPELLSTHIHTHGADGQNLLLPGGGSKTTPISHESVDKGKHLLNIFEANLSFRVAVRYFIESIKEAVRHNHVSIQDIDWFIPHQANLRMFQNISKSLKIPFDKFYLTVHKYGNISSASCAISLDEAVREHHIQPGHLICLPVFGGGLSWGSALIKW